MNSPDSARAISIKQEEPENIPIKQEEPEEHPHLNILHMVVCKEEVSAEQKSPSLLQSLGPEPPHIKEKQEELKVEELLQRPEEPDGSMLTSFAVKSKEDDDDISSSHCFEVEVELESDTEVTEDLRDKNVKSFSESGRPKTHQRIDPRDETFHCKYCGKSVSDAGFLKTHERLCNGEKSYDCKYCDKRFSGSRDFQQHIERTLMIPGGEMGEQERGRERGKIGEREGVRSQSSQTQFFSCSECSYALRSKVLLHKHIRLRHSDLYCQMLRNGLIAENNRSASLKN